ncbi:hypothetical protein LTR08_007049 [Meristemomyces frigidus]|nr:hypothetical protein LTR08_007049 [Meristemomyces frigidus]
MLPTRTLTRSSASPSHVCLSCRRAKTQRRFRHTHNFDSEHTVGSQGLPQDENAGNTGGDAAAAQAAGIAVRARDRHARPERARDGDGAAPPNDPVRFYEVARPGILVRGGRGPLPEVVPRRDGRKREREAMNEFLGALEAHVDVDAGVAVEVGASWSGVSRGGEDGEAGRREEVVVLHRPAAEVVAVQPPHHSRAGQEGVVVGADQRSTANSDSRFLDSLEAEMPLVRKSVAQSDIRKTNVESNSITAGTLPIRRYFAHPNTTLHVNPNPTRAPGYYTSSRAYHQAAAPAGFNTSQLPPDIASLAGTAPLASENPKGIRAQLRKWQELHGNDMVLNDDIGLDADPDTGDVANNLTRLPDDPSVITNTAAEQDDDDREAMAHFMQAPSDEPSTGAEANPRFLKMGELVELDYAGRDRENIVAVYVRSTGTQIAQFYTMQGRWVHMPEKRVQYSIPGWVDAEMIKPLLEFLPSPDEVENNIEKLMSEAYIKDLSVPRRVSAPLVKRMLEFHAEAQEIYRRHAGTLDNAHNLLAHETDLRYGSLVSAATTLLKMPADKLPVTALYAVRQALSHAGFAFNIDRRSHRLTGYLQIRSKGQVKMVAQVQRWLREWQDDLASTSTMTEEQRRRHRTSKGASYVYGFIDKAKQIVLKSREDRQPTRHGNIGPSKVRIPLTPEQDCIRVTKNEEFTEQDTELVRFVEAWSLSQMFAGLPRVESLPPLILQATGLYADMELKVATGLVFLQEIGTVMPYENRVRFDQHLLLPSSQHSRPLQNLMASLLEMQDKHEFVDSMADLRHDWGDLPVYCIDAASAHEIDDGLSIEPVRTADGQGEVKDQWWVHVHIANPTAFFSRDHPLAKMARHMGESIYMPERTYMMLPRWATQRHFSLAPNRPCLTFSARVDAAGQTLETAVRPGRVRNVLKLTHDEVRAAMGVSGTDGSAPELTLTVGGDPPSPRPRKSQSADLTPQMLLDLTQLQLLGEKRADLRRAQGGLFFDTHKPEVEVYQSFTAPGLAWDHPHRRGSRSVEGDPVIRMRTRGLVNWFSPFTDPVGTLVRETMLLACGVAATWCRERGIPAVFRGSVARPDRMDSAQYFREFLAPAARESAKGEFPMHLGMRYLETFGNTGLRTSPFRHRVLGMAEYGKVTSPLRRYGDMIVHWQIEAALREEARTGRSLKVLGASASTIHNDIVTSAEEMQEQALAQPKLDRRFLPFSTPVLRTILIGLHPRETIIMRAKQSAEAFWMTMLLFRAIHFSEIPPHLLPFGADGRTVHAYVHSPPVARGRSMPLAVMIREVNFVAMMGVPEGGVGGVRQGDVWEAEVVEVDVWLRTVVLRPRRLVERVE